MTETSLSRSVAPPENRQRRKHLMVVIGLALAIVAAIGPTMDVEKRLSALKETPESEGVWDASRAERDLAQLAAIGQDKPALRALISDLQGSLGRLMNSETVRELPIAPMIFRDLQELSAQLQSADQADDAALATALPRLQSEAQRLLPRVSNLARLTHDTGVAQAQANREALSGTLYRMGATAISLVLILTVFAVVLLRLSRQAQQQAARQHDTATRLQRIFETSLDAVLVFDCVGRIHSYNTAAERIFGYPHDVAIGASIGELMVPRDRRAAFFQAMQTYAITGHSRIIGAGRLEMEALRSDGSVFPVEVSVDQINESDGPVFVAFMRDITERREAAASLVEARDKALAGERTKAEFLAVMSHEMRTPLNGLLGTLSLLRDTPLDEKQAAYVRNMAASGQLLMHHVNDVLEISKFEAGKVLIAHTAFALDPLLAELIEGQSSVAEANQNSLGYEWLSDPVPAMMGDPVRLRQVLLNLISNAIKFTRNGSVSLECEVVRQSGEEWLEFRVIDTGIGIAEENLGRIFGDFETLDSTYGRRTEGTGLGLGISRRLTEAMGGEIGVESIEGAGSIFHVRLPLERAELQDEAEGGIAQDIGSRALDILIVEDNQINRVVLRDMLLAEGHDVTEALNGEEGVRMAEMRNFDIILMDISMPVMDGVQATRAIRSGNGPCTKTPILAVTAHALADEIATFRNAGMNDIIGKPIERRDLLAKLITHCGGSEGAKPSVLGQAMDATEENPVQPAEAGPVDDIRLRELMNDLGTDATEQLLHRFIRETDATLEEIGVGEAQAMGELVPRLHKIAGSAAVLGASTLHSRLGRLEALGKSGKEEPFREELAELAPIWAATRQKMVNVVARS